MDNPYQTNLDWERIAQRVVGPQQIVLTVGAVDVGKSTFCRFLIEQGISHGLKVAFVDADVGQSQIGPPTTIGLKCFTPNQTPPLSLDVPPDEMYFVGSITPDQHLLQCTTGTRLMVDAALDADADFIVIDTTGYIDGVPAIILKQHKIELITPDHIICIHRSRELEPIVGCFEGLELPQIHRISPHKSVTSKSSEFRRKYREAALARYFSDCVEAVLPFNQFRGQRTPFFIGRRASTKDLELLSSRVEERVLYAEWGHRSLTLVTPDVLSSLAYTRLKSHLSLNHLAAETSGYFEGRFIGLLDAMGKTVSVGLIEAADFAGSQLKIQCKPGVVSATKIVQFGKYKAQTENL